jgi:serine/threonine protein kinase
VGTWCCDLHTVKWGIAFSRYSLKDLLNVLGRNRDETFCNITSVKYHEVGYLSKPAKDFISRLFVRDMRKRANVDECLRHPWIRPELAELAEMRRTSSVISGAQLRSFKIRMRWRVGITI